MRRSAWRPKFHRIHILWGRKGPLCSLTNPFSSYYLAHFLLVAMGLYFSLIYLETVRLHLDEAITLLTVRGVLQHGALRVVSGLFYEQGIACSHLYALFHHLFGLGQRIARIASLIVSGFASPLLYLAGRMVFSEHVA